MTFSLVRAARRGARLSFGTLLALAALGALAPRRAAAQVGSLPQSSPFRDLDWRQELTLLGGHFNAGQDPARVAPNDASVFGVRYGIHLAGPAEFYARSVRTTSDRLVIDPRLPAPTRYTGAKSDPVYLTDIGIALNLTGQKTWHGLIPVVGAGAGIASDFAGSADYESSTFGGGYRFGTTFALTGGLGLRWVPGSGRFQLRGDVTDYLYQIKYPSSFYTISSDKTSVVGESQSNSFWRHNGTFTLGVSYLFFR